MTPSAALALDRAMVIAAAFTLALLALGLAWRAYKRSEYAHNIASNALAQARLANETLRHHSLLPPPVTPGTCALSCRCGKCYGEWLQAGARPADRPPGDEGDET